MEQMTQANEQQLEQKKITKKELSKAFWIYQLGCELSTSSKFSFLCIDDSSN